MHCPCTGTGVLRRQVSIMHSFHRCSQDLCTSAPQVPSKCWTEERHPPACPACLLALLRRLRKIVRVKAEAAGRQVFVAAAAVGQLALLALSAIHQAQPGPAPQAAVARLAVRAALKALQRWGFGCEAVAWRAGCGAVGSPNSCSNMGPKSTCLGLTVAKLHPKPSLDFRRLSVKVTFTQVPVAWSR